MHRDEREFDDDSGTHDAQFDLVSLAFRGTSGGLARPFVDGSTIDVRDDVAAENDAFTPASKVDVAATEAGVCRRTSRRDELHEESRTTGNVESLRKVTVQWNRRKAEIETWIQRQKFLDAVDSDPKSQSL